MRISIALLAFAASSFAQDPVMTALRSLYDGHRRNILEAAAKVPEKDFGFRPTPDVMTFGQQLAHIADVNHSICASLKGEKNPGGGLAHKHLDHMSFLAAVEQSFDYCKGALGATTDAQLAEMQGQRTRAWNALHLLEHMTMHYGNLITYMRIRGLVPPETERRQAGQKKK